MGSQLSGIAAPPIVTLSAGRSTVLCEQAIFTSVRTAMGEGYRLIAAGAGLTPLEKTEITRRSPSHGGLCRDDADATAVAFYPLPNGRICVARSCMAGQEQSGRGGRRVFTHAVVIERFDLSAFAYNPFNVLRAMESAGLGEPELKPAKTLPPVHLTVDGTCRVEETESAIADAGIDWLCWALAAVLSGRRVILAGEAGLPTMVEAVLLGIPGSMRAEVSFACGVKFSISRAFSLTGISGDASSTERIIRGHPLSLVRPGLEVSPPPFERMEWPAMAAERWAAGAGAELLRFTAQEFSDYTSPALERIAALRNDMTRVASAGPAELLEVAGRRLARSAAEGVESHVLGQLLGTIRLRLERFWSGASAAELAVDFPALLALVEKSPEAMRHAVTLVGLVLHRLATLAPATGIECALRITDQQVALAVRGELDEVLRAARDALPEADPAEAKSITRNLDRWEKAFPR